MIPSFSIDQKDEQASRPPETADAPAAAQAPDARRAGALSPSGSDYLAASDVHRAQVFGRCPVQSGMARYRVARKVMSQTCFGSRTTIRLIEATNAVQQWRDQVPNGILTHTPIDAPVWRQNEAMTPRDPQDRTMERLGLYWNWKWNSG